MAVMVFFEMAAEDDQHVTYRYGFNNELDLDRHMTIDKQTEGLSTSNPPTPCASLSRG